MTVSDEVSESHCLQRLAFSALNVSVTIALLTEQGLAQLAPNDVGAALLTYI